MLHSIPFLYRGKSPFAALAIALLLTMALASLAFAAQTNSSPDLGVDVNGPPKEPLIEGDLGTFDVSVTNQTTTTVGQKVKFSISVEGHPTPGATVSPPPGVKCKALQTVNQWICEVNNLKGKQKITVKVNVQTKGPGNIRVNSAVIGRIDQSGFDARYVDPRSYSTAIFQLPLDDLNATVRLVGEARTGDELIKFDQRVLDNNGTLEVRLVGDGPSPSDGIMPIDSLRATLSITRSAVVPEVTSSVAHLDANVDITRTASLTTSLTIFGVPSTGEAQIVSNSPISCGMNVYKQSSSNDVTLNCSQTNRLAWLNQRDVRFAKFVSSWGKEQGILAAGQTDGLQSRRLQIVVTAKPDQYQIYMPSIER